MAAAERMQWHGSESWANQWLRAPVPRMQQNPAAAQMPSSKNHSCELSERIQCQPSW